MAPLPTETTDRWFLDYTTGNVSTSTEHTMMIRSDGNLGVDGASGNFLAILNGVGAANFWAGWRPLRMRHAAAGSSFSLPAGMGATLSAFVGTGSTSSYISTLEAVEATVQFRSYTTGRRGDLSLYGIRFTGMPTAFRMNASNGAPWSTLLTAMAGIPVPLRVIDGSQATVYPYVNLNFNSYWESRIRSV